MSEYLQLTDAGSLYPRQFSSIFGRQDSSMNQFMNGQSMLKPGLQLGNQQPLARQSSIDASFAPINHSGYFFRSPSVAADSMIQSSIDETSTDSTYKQPINHYVHQYRQPYYQPAYFSDGLFPNQPPMLPHSPASSASTSASRSPPHEYESCNQQLQQPVFEQSINRLISDTISQPVKEELSAQFPSMMTREFTASLPALSQPSAQYQFNYAEPESSELDDSEFEFSPITTTRQVWSTPSHRRTLADGSAARQRSASGELEFTVQQQAMITAWSNHQAKLVQLPPPLSHSELPSNPVKKEVPSPKHVPVDILTRSPIKLSSHPLLPPGVDPNEIVIGTYTRAERAAKIARYREKRARRKWTKKIMYDCRKSFADNRPRVGGRFIKMKEQPKSR